MVKYQDNQASGQFWICKWQKQTVSSGQCVRMNQLSFPSSCLSVRYSSREGTSTWPSRDWTPSPLSASRDEQRTMTHSPTKPAYSGGGSILQKKEIECWWRKTTDVLCIPTVGCQATPSHFFPCHIQFLKCLCLTYCNCLTYKQKIYSTPERREPMSSYDIHFSPGSIMILQLDKMTNLTITIHVMHESKGREKEKEG